MVAQKYMCYMGNMMLAKDNVDNIIRAFKRICDDFPDIDLYLYGTPSEKDKKLSKVLFLTLAWLIEFLLKGE